ncbi:MAG: ATP-binding cassette domain-containing protein, partial [Pseudomonadota bacterium]
YMLQIYDRILTSGSSDTLAWLTGIALFLLVIYGLAEAGRRRLCTLAAEAIEEKISERVFQHFETEPAGQARLTDDLSVLGRVRSLYQNGIILPFFDLPFVPFFLAILFLIHPFIGLLGLGGAILIFCVAAIAELTSRKTTELASAASTKAFHIAAGLSRQRSAMIAMGLAPEARTKWREAKRAARDLNLKAGAREGGFSAVARAARQILQILVLGGGAALALNQEISPGAIVAGSIILSRALAPVDQIVGSWRAITQARLAWEQLVDLRDMREADGPVVSLPRPEPELAVSRLSVGVPGAEGPVIRPFGVKLERGAFVAIVGNIGTGKTTLLQTLAGAWEPFSGEVSLGGRNIHNWPSEDRGKHFGYVPQDVELMPGTIAENIARMGNVESAAVIDAAQRAGAHDMILAQTDGYETEIGAQNETGLSAGQRQLVGLARAFFGTPVILLLDEPTANLDKTAAARVIASLKAEASAGAIVIVATHDPQLIAAAQSVMLIRDGVILSASAENYLKASEAGPGDNITSIGARAS